MLPRRIFRLSPDQDGHCRPGEDILHHALWRFLVHLNALWFEKRRALKEQIGRNVHAYVDDIVVKSQLADSLVIDLQETFKNLRTYQMKLNPAKCTFGVPTRKLLGYIVSERGIEANPEKINAIMSLQKPASIKGVQRLTGCVAALSRFISRLGEKAIPLYRPLKKNDKFV